MTRSLSGFLVVAAVAMLAFSGATAGQSASPVGRDQAVNELLASPAARFLTPQALMSLTAMAGRSQGIGADPAGEQVGAGAAQRAATTAEPDVESARLANVRVNDPRQDSHQTDQTTQSETSVAVSGSHVVVGFNDSQQALLFPTAGASLSGVAFSSNGGRSFTDAGALPNQAGCFDVGDPWLTADRGGAIYYSTLVSCASGGFVGVAKSTDGGRKFSPPVVIIPQSAGSFFFADKPALTAGRDPQASGRDVLYDAWDDFSFGGIGGSTLAGLAVARSTDAGAHWTVTYASRAPLTQPCPNNPGFFSFTQFIGAQPIVDPATGTLRVAAEKLSQGCPGSSASVAGGGGGGGGGGGTPPPIRPSEVIFTSTDGGQHFGPEAKIADATFSFPSGALELAPGRLMRNAEFPTLAMLGSDLVATWNDGRSGRSHVLLSRSSDAVHWSAPVDVTSGNLDELQPAISSDGSRLDVAYYQRRADNTLEVRVARSTDGATFTTSRVSDRSFPGALTFPQFDPIIAQGYMGDYIANVAVDGHRYLAWGDNRDVVTNFMYPDGRPDPDVFFARD